jgi:hypothetical protein
MKNNIITKKMNKITKNLSKLFSKLSNYEKNSRKYKETYKRIKKKQKDFEWFLNNSFSEESVESKNKIKDLNEEEIIKNLKNKIKINKSKNK